METIDDELEELSLQQKKYKNRIRSHFQGSESDYKKVIPFEKLCGVGEE